MMQSAKQSSMRGLPWFSNLLPIVRDQVPVGIGVTYVTNPVSVFVLLVHVAVLRALPVPAQEVIVRELGGGGTHLCL